MTDTGIPDIAAGGGCGGGRSFILLVRTRGDEINIIVLCPLFILD